MPIQASARGIVVVPGVPGLILSACTAAASGYASERMIPGVSAPPPRACLDSRTFVGGNRTLISTCGKHRATADPSHPLRCVIPVS